jgi:probable F420-dependent oxidoreductase
MHLSGYLGQPNYRNNFRRQGFSENDMTNGGSDRLVDAIVAWGSLEQVVARVQQHRDAGADHVAVQVLPREMSDVPMDEWRTLAAALGV